MKADQIKVGGVYVARVSGKLTKVRVDAVRTQTVRRGNDYAGRPQYAERAAYDVTNLATGRKTTFRSAQKFRGVAK